MRCGDEKGLLCKPFVKALLATSFPIDPIAKQNVHPSLHFVKIVDEEYSLIISKTFGLSFPAERKVATFFGAHHPLTRYVYVVYSYYCLGLMH